MNEKSLAIADSAARRLAPSCTSATSGHPIAIAGTVLSVERLEAILRERIAVLDGSWGVLIQRQVRGEEAYRGERFRDHPRDVAGDPTFST